MTHTTKLARPGQQIVVILPQKQLEGMVNSWQQILVLMPVSGIKTQST